MKLSILICSLPNRRDFLKKMKDNLRGQADFTANSTVKSGTYSMERIVSADVEILICTDNKEMKVGAKRNLLIEKSIGDYFVFVDDDDRVTDDYIPMLLAGVENNSDVVLFDVECSIDGGRYKKVIYDVNYIRDRNLKNSYLRIPNHIMCWKRKIKGGVEKFPNINMGEDAQWARGMRDKITSQSRIPKTLYYYDFSNQTTETQ